MKVQPNLYHINDVFEIKIRNTEWQIIKSLAYQFELTYTSIVRLCLFQFTAMKRLNNLEVYTYKSQIKRKYGVPYLESSGESLHRHMLCLYGQDAMQIRLIAARYGFTISGLVRIAIELYLTSLEAALASKKLDVVRHGIKVYARVNEEANFSSDMDFPNKLVKFKTFDRESYWPWRKFPFFGFG